MNNWQSIVPYEWNTLFFSTRLVTIVLLPSVLRRENSNSCEISHFPVSKQTMKIQFSLDVLGNNIFCIKCGKAKLARALKYAFRSWHERYFLFAVYRKLAESVSFYIRKVDFPALVRKNLKFVFIFSTLKILSH